jgi:hypothetical protein
MAGGRFDVETEVLMLDEDAQLSPSDVVAVDDADAAVFEVSEDDARIAYLYGKLRANGLPCLLLRSRRADSISDAFLLENVCLPVLYNSLADTLSEQKSIDELTDFCRAVEDRWEQGHPRLERLLSQVWFGERGGDVHVICPPSYDDLPSASRTSPNYIHLDKLGDKDAFLEVAMFLSRMYGSRVIPYTPSEFPARQLLRDDLIVIGGPGFGAEDDGNPIALDIMRRVAMCVEYQEQPPVLTCTHGEDVISLGSEFASSGELSADVGLFARFPSPFNPERTVILIQGMHTAGVLGAAQALVGTTAALVNADVLERCLRDQSDWTFVAVMRVELLRGDVLIPRLDEQYVVPL